MDTSPVKKSDANISQNSFFKETIKIIVIAFFIVLPIRVFIAQPFIVSGSSMYPTFENGDYLIVDQVSYRINEPKRLDVIVFRYPKDPSKFFIKRIIALPNETININNGVVSVLTTDGENITLDEPYVQNERRDTLKKTLGEGEYFVMGDNRSASSDSRIWGTLDKKFLIGKTFLRLLPVTHIGFNPGGVEDEGGGASTLNVKI